jgi:hypothetical protein
MTFMFDLDEVRALQLADLKTVERWTVKALGSPLDRLRKVLEELGDLEDRESRGGGSWEPLRDALDSLTFSFSVAASTIEFIDREDMEVEEAAQWLGPVSDLVKRLEGLEELFKRGAEERKVRELMEDVAEALERLENGDY